jgi:hypothetical protein
LNQKDIAFRRSLIEMYLIRGKGVRQISSILMQDHEIPASPATVCLDKKILDAEIMKEKDQYLQNMPILMSRLRDRINELTSMAYKIHDTTQSNEIQLRAISLIKDLTVVYAQLADDSTNINEVPDILTRTAKKVDELKQIKEKEIPVF